MSTINPQTTQTTPDQATIERGIERGRQLHALAIRQALTSMFSLKAHQSPRDERLPDRDCTAAA